MEVAGPRAFVSEIHTREKNAREEILGEQKDILKICKKKKKSWSLNLFQMLRNFINKTREEIPRLCP